MLVKDLKHRHDSLSAADRAHIYQDIFLKQMDIKLNKCENFVLQNKTSI